MQLLAGQCLRNCVFNLQPLFSQISLHRLIDRRNFGFCTVNLIIHVVVFSEQICKAWVGDFQIMDGFHLAWKFFRKSMWSV